MGVVNEKNAVENVRPSGFGVRHVQTVMLFFGMLLAFTMRVNISMAIVVMTDVTNEKSYDWDSTTKSMILSSFFWGYVVLQIPAGMLARKVGGKLLITISVAVNSLISLFIPTAAAIGGWKLVCACRFLQGLTQAFVYPSMHHLISQWIPLEEKGLLSTIIYAGGQLGTSLQLIASGFLAATWGWPAIFYTNATLGAIWSVAYTFLGSASPEQSKFMKEDELLYIQRSLGRVGEQKRFPTPWLKIMTSLPFWAVIIAHCGQNWGFFTLMTEMPTYMSKVLNMELKSNGILSSLPYLAMFLLSFSMGAMTDLILRRSWLSVTNTRKLFNSIGLWGPAVAMIGLSYAPAGNSLIAVTMLVLAVGINAGQFTGYMLVHIDLAPNFSACLMGITNFLANIISIISPLVCGAIVQDETDTSQWRIVFFVASGVYFFTNLFFVLFATSERQDWNEPKEDTTSEKRPHWTNPRRLCCGDSSV
ncbi:putative inorganic phosphate cotransporter [Plodia interpunctella]|uniref:putative inorganic phosphate cotransporter n=1 Tax=Plodia interpunctella TaxID=58824 RepID=UPI002367CBF8|nr:putative inorganic phosphate cotransporter [Plodia interpunctella]